MLAGPGGPVARADRGQGVRSEGRITRSGRVRRHRAQRPPWPRVGPAPPTGGHCHRAARNPRNRGQGVHWDSGLGREPLGEMSGCVGVAVETTWISGVEPVCVAVVFDQPFLVVRVRFDPTWEELWPHSGEWIRVQRVLAPAASCPLRDPLLRASYLLAGWSEPVVGFGPPRGTGCGC